MTINRSKFKDQLVEGEIIEFRTIFLMKVISGNRVNNGVVKCLIIEAAYNF